MTNGQLAELLWRESEQHEGHRARVLRRAARAALLWPEEASAMAEAHRSLTELRGVGPWIARIIVGWLEEPPEMDEPPALRAVFLTMAEARATLAEHPEWRASVRADLQVHTTYSDGRGTLEDMVRAAAGYGYESVAITDHSKGLPIAGGMDEAELLAQGEAIDELNETLETEGVRIHALRAIEMNLGLDGSGDMDPEVLRQLDLVLGAFHSRLRVTEDQTDRYLAALRNPRVHVLAHPRGRRFGVRLGLRADWPRVFAEAEARDVAVEIDAFPDRQDLDVDLLRLARDAGCRISIGSDAHRVEELGHLDLGIAAAIIAGIARERILSFMPRQALLEWRNRRAGV